MSLLSELYSRRALSFLDWSNVFLWGICFWIGQLQSSEAPRGFVTSYGADLVGPFTLLWPLRRTLFREQRHGTEFAAVLILVGCYLWEASQLVEGGLLFGITAGTFDPLDFAAYTFSVAIGTFIDLRMRSGWSRRGARS